MTQQLPLKMVFLTGTLLSCSILAVSQDAEPPPPTTQTAAPADQDSILSPTAPQSYTVRTGDTLWDIASTFLRDPWLWPEIWYVNPQVENPHLIYPGDILALVYGKDGKPQIVLQRGDDSTRLSPQIRSQPLDGAIQTIPYDMIAAFMSRPAVLDKSEIKSAPHVLSSRDQHLMGAAGNTIYARGTDDEQAGAHYTIVHVGEPLRDPDDKDVVGYHCYYTASARVTRGGDPATLLITESERETLDGDKLLPADPQIATDFMPRAPEQEINGRIMFLVNGIEQVGQYQVVVINRGKKHGLEPGHVLGIYQAGVKVRDKNAAGFGSKLMGSKVKLPDERTGTFMVFKTYERISYGLVMKSEAPIRNLDRVSNP